MASVASLAATSFFTSLTANEFIATELTRGPWDVKQQHAGPLSALLVRAMEAKAAELKVPNVCRVTVTLERPAPIAAPLRVTVDVERAGRKMALLNARLLDVSEAGQPRALARAQATALRTESVPAAEFPVLARQTQLRPSRPFAQSTPVSELWVEPNGVHSFWRRSDGSVVAGYQTAVECRRGDDRPFCQGATLAWSRSIVPLLPGEQMTSMQRVVISADAASGWSAIVPDIRQWSSVNADLTVSLLRPLCSSWVGLEARTDAWPSAGSALTSTHIFDEEGSLVGTSMQSLILERRQISARL